MGSKLRVELKWLDQSSSFLQCRVEFHSLSFSSQVMLHQPASSLPDTLQDVECHSDHSAALGMELVTLATTQDMEMETLATIQAMEAHGEMETLDIIQDMEMETPGTAMEILATILALEAMKTLVITLEMSPAMLVRKRRVHGGDEGQRSEARLPLLRGLVGRSPV